jgi:hypothetical protein
VIRLSNSAVDGGHGRVGGGQRAEVAGEPLLVLVVQANAAEDERLVLVQGGPDVGDGLGLQDEVGGEAGDLGPMRPVISRMPSFVPAWIVVMTGPPLLVTAGVGWVRRVSDTVRCTPA